MDDAQTHRMVEFLKLAGRLKSVKRTGWLDRGIPEAETESVADHTFRVALLAWLAAGEQPELDRTRVLELALIHDLAEAGAGDRTPYDHQELATAEDRNAFLNQRHEADPARKAAKRAAEQTAFVELTALLPADRQAELDGLWEELLTQATPEARFVKEVDRLETYLQSIDYLDRFPGTPVESFRLEVRETITNPLLQSLRDVTADDQDA